MAQNCTPPLHPGQASCLFLVEFKSDCGELWIRRTVRADVLDMFRGLEKLLPFPHPYVNHIFLREARTAGDNRKKLV